MVGWWQGEGDAYDEISGSNGVVYPGTTFTTGVVGQCFSFDGVSGCVMNTNTPPLTNIQDTFTMEFWAYPRAGYRMLPEGGGVGTSGQSYAIFPDWGGYGGMAGAGVCVGTNGISVMEHADNYMPSMLSYTNDINGWVHVAVVYTNKQPVLYVNGVKVRTGITSTETAVYPSKNLGNSYASADGYQFDTYGPYNGLLDEVSIYNRALSQDEILAIYNAGSSGKCPPPPTIITQPTNQILLPDGTAVFNVIAGGGAPLSYQWSFDGTNVANATNATLTLTDVQLNDAGSYSVTITNPYGSTNSAASLMVVLPPVITQQPQSQTVLSYSSASFNVGATGTAALTYQWQKNGTNLVDGGNISGSATTNLTLASVSVGDAGNYGVVVSNSYGMTNSVPAVLTVPETAFMLGSTNAMSGNTVIVPVLMNALGVENAFETSVVYDPTKLVLQWVQPGEATAGAYLQEVDTETNSGYVGFAVLLNTGATVPAGTQEVAELVFHTLPVTNSTTVNLVFGDNPDPRQLVDNNLDSLPATYQGGTVTLVPAEYEADVYPRTNGDHQVNLQDWGEEGRMVAGLDVPTNSDEMLRADCAPRGAPDGVLTVADWVQAGRYALGLDPLTLVLASNPEVSELKAQVSGVQPNDAPSQIRILQVNNVAAQRGQTVNVPVQLVCITNENAVGMTVSYNTNQLTLLNVSLGTNATGARLDVNSSRAAGEVGVALALSPGATLLPGTNQVAVLEFAAAASASGTAALGLNSGVVILQVVDKTADVLPADYVNGAVVLPSQPSVTVTGAGTGLQLSWPMVAGAFEVQTAAMPVGPWTTIVMPLITNGANVSVMVSPTNQQQYFRLLGQ